MWFKNISAFSVQREMPDNFGAMLAEHQLREPGPLEQESRGFVSPFVRDGSALSHSSSGCTLFCAGNESRMLPAPVLSAEVAKRIAQYEEMNWRKPGRRARLELRSAAIAELLPRAFIKRSRTGAYLDSKIGMLIVDTASGYSVSPSGEARSAADSRLTAGGVLPASRRRAQGVSGACDLFVRAAFLVGADSKRPRTNAHRADAVYRREACATDLGCYNGHRSNLVRVPRQESSHHTAPAQCGVCVCGDCTPKQSAVNPTKGSIKALDALRLAVHDRRHEHHMATTHPRPARQRHANVRDRQALRPQPAGCDRHRIWPHRRAEGIFGGQDVRSACASHALEKEGRLTCKSQAQSSCSSSCR